MNYKNKVLKVGTFFSGIGSPEKALQKLKEENIIKDFKVEFFSEIDKSAIKSYCAIHNIDESLNLGDITKIKGIELPYCDLWIGGFPCQDISCAGKMRGFDSNTSTRSSLGWEMIRLLSEVNEKPKVVIFENVEMITSKKFRDTLLLFKNDLNNLGYKLYDNVLSATDYGIPQTRKRYFLIAFLDNDYEYTFPDKIKSDIIFKDILEDKVDEEYYLTTDKYEVLDSNTLLFKNKNREDIEYEVYLDCIKKGGVCGKDKHTKFHQAARVFSTNKNAPTMTANNTSDNTKIVVED